MSDSKREPKKSRNSSDELEILREIIASDKHLFEKVLTRIRSLQSVAKQGILDEMSGKTVDSQERRKMNVMKKSVTNRT